MHRTQLLLEDWQYRALKSLAERQGISISELFRRRKATA
jgi:predicted DNA-binding ribbon-helix-helix protein